MSKKKAKPQANPHLRDWYEHSGQPSDNKKENLTNESAKVDNDNVAHGRTQQSQSDKAANEDPPRDPLEDAVLPPRSTEAAWVVWRPLLDVATVHDKMQLALGKSGMTQEQVGVRLGFPTDTAKQNVNYLIKRSREPGVIKVALYAHVTGFSLAELLELTDGPPQSSRPRAALSLPTLQERMRSAITRAGSSQKEVGRRIGFAEGLERSGVWGLLSDAHDQDHSILLIDRLACATNLTLPALLRLPRLPSRPAS